MSLPALTQEPLETALRAKVRDLFGDLASLRPGTTHEGDPLLEIRTTLGVDDPTADRHLDAIYDWILDRYPYDDTVVGLRHVHHL